jgi:hypothetical protein
MSLETILLMVLISNQLSAQGYAPVPEFYTGAWANVGRSPPFRSGLAEPVYIGQSRTSWHLQGHPHDILATDHQPSRERYA